MFMRTLSAARAIGAMALFGGLTSCGNRDAKGTPDAEGDSMPAEDIGAWDDGKQQFAKTQYVRPPGRTYGAGDGSSWTDAFADLPEELERGARYLVASGNYDETTPRDDEPYTDYTFDDREDGDRFIAVVKATADDHGSNEGWEASLAQGPAVFGPLSMATGHYLLDGVEGTGTSGHGIRIVVNPAVCGNSHANAFYFDWNAQSHYVGLHHLDIGFCGDVGDPAEPAQDAIYGYMTDRYDVGNVTIRDSYVHDTKRVLAFFLGWTDVLLERSFFERSGQHHESSSLAMRDARHVVVRNNVFKDAINVFVSLQDVRDVHIYGNVFVSTLAGWDIWNSIHSSEPMRDVFIHNNTFYGHTGLSTGFRFTGTTSNVQVSNNLWAHNRTNQIPMAGDHDYNAFFDNI
ncbi:MAG: right-handed parallel beta-helix repeat-containing protein, partial [Polyangiaceae bacterium]|nr:right-handed parallel beta-helix repeat-containing protein [Polyangiaceae bacterium]